MRLLRAERSNLTYYNYLYLLECFVAALLAMTRWMIFYECIIICDVSFQSHVKKPLLLLKINIYHTIR